MLSSTRRWLALAFLALIAVIFATCSPLYVIRAGLEEARILGRRRPITEIVADPGTPTETRRKLDLVTQARSFAENQLDLDAGESYTTYSWVDSDTLVMVVTAARKDRFVGHTWWFPVVGRMPYKGFFNFEDAYREARALEEAGYDTDVRPSGAFSTLGWFNDPVLNTILRYGDVSLVGTVVHEITHNTIYLTGQGGFNESFANFVGDRGATVFFCTREGTASANCRNAEAAWQDNIVFGNALTELVRALEQLYNRTDLTSAQKIAQRGAVFKAWATNYRSDVAPKLKTRAFLTYADDPLNNARLIGTRLYYQRLDLFEAVYQRYGRDLKKATHAMIAAAEARPKDPFAAVEGLLK